MQEIIAEVKENYNRMSFLELLAHENEMNRQTYSEELGKNQLKILCEEIEKKLRLYVLVYR